MCNFYNIKYILCAFIVVFATFQVSAQNALENSGNLQMHAGAEMAFFGDLTNNGAFNNNLGEALFSGSSLQTISGANNLKFENITINNSSDVKLDQEMQISGILSFSSGKIKSDRSDIATEYVHFLDGATYSGSNANKFIDGVVRKTGDDAFTFPLGDGTNWARLGISAPSVLTDTYTATYNRTAYSNTTTMAITPTPVLNNVSSLEYWICDRTNGSSNVTVQLSWEDANQSVINDYSTDLVVARWNGSAWENAGQSTITPLSPGNITSELVSSFSPFTFGSLSVPLNILPVELINFNAKVMNTNQVRLDWETVSEINNDYFIVERSKNSESWEEVVRANGAGNSSTTLFYNTIDDNPYVGISYYRLKQVDFDGEYSYSELRSVNIDKLNDASISIYPNPTRNIVTIKSSSLVKIKELRIYNNLGQDVTANVNFKKFNESHVLFDLVNLPRGIYTLKTNNTINKVIKQ